MYNLEELVVNFLLVSTSSIFIYAIACSKIFLMEPSLMYNLEELVVHFLLVSTSIFI